MTFSILKPVDLGRSNHTLLYEVVNRGNKLINGSINVGATAANPAGDGFVEKQGFILVWSGWQGDVVPDGVRQAMTVVPVARAADGARITGEVRQEYTPSKAVPAEPLAGNAVTAPIESATLDNATATLTRRARQEDPKEVIPRDQWAFADCSAAKPFPGAPSSTHVCLQGGFDTDHIYELVYTGIDPKVLGIGFAATRDLVSFLRSGARGQADEGGDGTEAAGSPGPANPLAGAVHHTLGFGISQSGRFLRTFLDLGFNEDENGDRVFDGVDAEIASYRLSLNVRFAQPTRLSGTQHTEKQFLGSESPTTWGRSHDRFAQVDGGLLDRCRHGETCPKVFNTVSSTEYWQAGMWATTVDADGEEDLEIPENVRIYQWAGTGHGGSPPAVKASQNPICEQLSNLNSYTYNFRALLLALRAWVVDGEEPPPSLYPTLRKGTLAPAGEIAFPGIPGVTFDHLFNSRQVLDRGPGFDARTDSGVMSEPPVARATYRELLPQVDADGNEVDGVRSTQLRVPLGTYSGWNTRKASFARPDLCDLTGQYVPFAVHAADRKGDPRPSLEERYGAKAEYLREVREAVQEQVDEGLLLPEDAATVIAQEQARDIGLP